MPTVPRSYRHIWFMSLMLLAVTGGAEGATVPAGFQDLQVASGVSAPAVLAFAPDGRLFIGEKATGRIRVVKNGVLLATPVVDLNTVVPAGTYFDSFYERGLLGIAFDPAFASTQLVYVYYSLCETPGSPPQPGTSTCVSAKNRVARFRTSGDVADAGSHTVLLDDIASDGGNHNAGWLGFGPTDGKLYVSTGDGGVNHARSQDLNDVSGKILRINSDGSIPADNPYAGQAGKRGEIWAAGFRNPWRCRFRSDGRLLCADVGEASWEEIDVVFRGNNYGWPTTEGPFELARFPQFTPPIHSYAHDGSNAAITGGDFGAATSFPGDYQQSYFFADFPRGWIKRALLDATGTAVETVESFATGLGGNNVTDLVGGPDGLYYTTYGSNAVRKIVAVTGNRAPVASAAASPTQILPGGSVTFSSSGSSDADGDPLTFTWNFGDGAPAVSGPAPTHAYQTAGAYTAVLTVSDGKPSPGPATATVDITVGNPPVMTISQPTDGATFQAGSTITLAGRADDPDEGALPSSSLHWKVTFHHDDHVHPYIDDLVGAVQSFTTANTGETSADVAYEIALSATDATGITATKSIVLVPQTAEFTVATDPPGLLVTLDGQTRVTPVTVTGVVGFRRTLGAVSPQSAGGKTYAFTSWSDGGVQTHTITTQAAAATYVAAFAPLGGTPTVATPTRTPTPAPARTSTPQPTWTSTPQPIATITPVTARTATPPATPSRTPVASATPGSGSTPLAGEDLTQLGVIIARVPNPQGGGSKDPEVIRDGDMPLAGSDAPSSRQYDTWDGANTATEDWIGYVYSTPTTFTRVVFQEGRHFWDGGWFESLTVQVRQNGVWTNVPGLISTPPYPGNNGINYETFVLDFPAIGGEAIRIVGRPGGSAAFISVAELEVFGRSSTIATPTPASGCNVSAAMSQTGARDDYWRVDGVMDRGYAPRQHVQNATPISICRLDLSLFNNTGNSGGSFHVAIWNDALSEQIGGDSDSVEVATLPTTSAPPTLTTITWSANPPQPADDFWIVLQSDHNFGAGVLVRWDSSTDELSYAGSAFNGNHGDLGDLHEDFSFTVFTGSQVPTPIATPIPSVTPTPSATSTPTRTCNTTATMAQTGPRSGYWRVENAMQPSYAPRQHIQNATPISICRLDLSLFNNTGAAGGSFHVEIWDDALSAKIGGDSDSTAVAALPTTRAPATLTTITWSANPPEPTGHFWIVLQSDDNFGQGVLVRWDTTEDELSYAGAAFNGNHGDIGDLHEDFSFSVFIRP
jgi:glucose/arabinose dehydrogenase